MNSSDSAPTLPRLESGSIERTRLLEPLVAARHKTCLLILGPAGSGKTTLALQWRAQVLTYGHDVAWMSVMPGDDAPTLLDALFVALDRVDTHIAREARFIYNRDSEMRSINAIAISLLRGLIPRSRPLVLLIDEYQNVADGWAHSMLQLLLDFAPANVHLVFVSRSVPPLFLSRLLDKDAVLELGFDDLRFSIDEVQSFVQSRHPGKPVRDALRLFDITDGSAAGLQLVSLDIKRHPGARVHRCKPRDRSDAGLLCRATGSPVRFAPPYDHALCAPTQ